MSFAAGAASGMVARADDASALAYNPAGITQIPGTSVLLGMTAIGLNFDLTNEGSDKVSTSDQIWPIPHGYLTHQINDKWWFGLAHFTRFGLGLQYPDNWGSSATKPGTASAVLKSITLLSSTVNPNLVYKLNDVWSLGAGVSYTWGYISLNQQYNMNSGFGNIHLGDVRMHSESGHSFGYNLALHALFNDSWSAGLTYRSKENMHLSGNVRFRNVNSSMINRLEAMGLVKASNFQNTSGKTNLTLPDVFTLGVMYKPLQNLSLEADMGYTVWSRWRSLDIDIFGQEGLHQQKNWRDTWTFGFSVEYWPVDWMALRAGVSYETSPLKDDQCYDYIVPSNGRTNYALGTGFKYDNWTLDFAYMYIDSRKINIPNNIPNEGTTTSTFKGRIDNGYAHSFSVSLGYRF
jgi:long-chain fatty acid transport protein